MDSIELQLRESGMCKTWSTKYALSPSLLSRHGPSIEVKLQYGFDKFSIDGRGYAMLCYGKHLLIELPEDCSREGLDCGNMNVSQHFNLSLPLDIGRRHLPHWKLPSLLPRRSDKLRSHSHSSPSAFRRRPRRTQTGPVPSMEHQMPSEDSEKPVVRSSCQYNACFLRGYPTARHGEE